MDSLIEINNDMRFEHFIDGWLDIDWSAYEPISGSGNTSDEMDEILGMAAIVPTTTSTAQPISPTQTHEFLVRLSPVARQLSPPQQQPSAPLVVSTPHGTAIQTVRHEQQTENASIAASNAVTIEIFATDDQEAARSHDLPVPVSSSPAAATPHGTAIQTVRLFGHEQQTDNASIAASNAVTIEIFATDDQEDGRSHDLPVPVSSSPAAATAAKQSLPIDFFCHQCDVRIKLHKDFKHHYRIAHDTVPPIYVCPQCPATKRFVSLKTYGKHVRRHSQRYPCAVCTRKFVSAELLAEHGRTHTTELLCVRCHEQFNDFAVYCEHVHGHRKPPAVRPIKWKCPDCGELFTNRPDLNNHAIVHRDAAAKTTTAAPDVGTSDAIIAIIAVPPAPLQLPQAPPAVVVVAAGAPQPQPTADIANETSAGRTQLLLHRDHHDHSERPFQCLTCSKRYRTGRDLRLHSRVHSEQRPHACTHCDKSFLTRNKLKQHMQVHTGERPYKCKYCDKDYTNRPNWVKHVRLSHNVDHQTGEQLEQLPNRRRRRRQQQLSLPPTTVTVNLTLSGQSAAPANAAANKSSKQ